MERIKKLARWFVITLGIVLLTSVTVDATFSTDSISQSALGILATSLKGKAPSCPAGTVRLGGAGEYVCVDRYEASPEPACAVREIKNAADTRINMGMQTCLPASLPDLAPWTFVTMQQSQELCARAGKRLLTNAEWYRASLGTPDISGETSCNIHSSGATVGGASRRCLSQAGVYDAIGNVWEWIDAQVSTRTFGNRELPEEGYVSETDGDGVVTKTASAPNEDYHADYFWSSNEAGVYGMLRGGFYGSETDAGLFSIQAKTAPSFSGNAIGFRCALDLKH